MKKLIAVGLAVGVTSIAGTPAFAAPADQGNCVSDRDNGGAAGERTSSNAGPGFGPAVAGAIGGGEIGDEASSPGCRRSG